MMHREDSVGRIMHHIIIFHNSQSPLNINSSLRNLVCARVYFQQVYNLLLLNFALLSDSRLGRGFVISSF